jgi:AraC-like DNA-binding protein
VAFLSRAEFEINKSEIITRESESTPFAGSIVARFRKPIIFTYEGTINEITIYFKPGRIHAFLDHQLSVYNKEDFNPFVPFVNCESDLTNILNHSQDEDKIIALEDFLLSKLKEDREPKLYQIISAILESPAESMPGINELGERFKMSRQSLHQLFHHFVGKSPSEFRKTVRFRKALESGVNQAGSKFLTGLALDNHYFDQSHMLKDFKSLTGQTPGQFFKSLSSIHEDTIFWKMT